MIWDVFIWVASYMSIYIPITLKCRFCKTFKVQSYFRNLLPDERWPMALCDIPTCLTKNQID